MAISQAAAGMVAEVILSHLDRRTALAIVQDLARVNGGESYHETLFIVERELKARSDARP